MAQLVKVIKYFDDGTETVHEFVPNANAAEIEAAVAEAQEGLEEEVVEAPVEEEVAESIEEVVAAEEVVE